MPSLAPTSAGAAAPCPSSCAGGCLRRFCAVLWARFRRARRPGHRSRLGRALQGNPPSPLQCPELRSRKIVLRKLRGLPRQEHQHTARQVQLDGLILIVPDDVANRIVLAHDTLLLASKVSLVAPDIRKSVSTMTFLAGTANSPAPTSCRVEIR